MLSPSARSSLDRIREKVTCLELRLVRSKRYLLLLKRKTAHSILDEMNLCISRYQKVSSFLKEKEQLITKMAALQSPLDSFQIKLGEEFLRVAAVDTQFLIVYMFCVSVTLLNWFGTSLFPMSIKVPSTPWHSRIGYVAMLLVRIFSLVLIASGVRPSVR